MIKNKTEKVIQRKVSKSKENAFHQTALINNGQ